MRRFAGLGMMGFTGDPGVTLPTMPDFPFSHPLLGLAVFCLVAVGDAKEGGTGTRGPGRVGRLAVCSVAVAPPGAVGLRIILRG